jgi:hypothetical protein
MVIHMRITLDISDAIVRALKREAERRGQTVSALVEEALQRILSAKQPATRLPVLPTFHGGILRVNVADRNALYDFMEQESHSKRKKRT